MLAQPEGCGKIYHPGAKHAALESHYAGRGPKTVYWILLLRISGVCDNIHSYIAQPILLIKPGLDHSHEPVPLSWSLPPHLRGGSWLWSALGPIKPKIRPASEYSKRGIKFFNFHCSTDVCSWNGSPQFHAELKNYLSFYIWRPWEA